MSWAGEDRPPSPRVGTWPSADRPFAVPRLALSDEDKAKIDAAWEAGESTSDLLLSPGRMTF